MADQPPKQPTRLNHICHRWVFTPLATIYVLTKRLLKERYLQEFVINHMERTAVLLGLCQLTARCMSERLIVQRHFQAIALYRGLKHRERSTFQSIKLTPSIGAPETLLTRLRTTRYFALEVPLVQYRHLPYLLGLGHRKATEAKTSLSCEIECDAICSLNM
ncbi:hypothetical protein KC319_g33 [Hortaea werneckii]|nr:hypothetical protein KC319_g33 [Hortaea werneckii]